MSTRATYGFIIDGEKKVTYNHSDGYPAGLGTDLLAWLHEEIAEDPSLNDLRERVNALKLVDDDGEPPTDDEIEALKKYSNTSVSSRSLKEWYVLLHETQGMPRLVLESGYMMSYPNCGDCEWEYLVNFDTMKFEVYGGLWSDTSLSLVAAYALGELPDDATLEKLEG